MRAAIAVFVSGVLVAVGPGVGVGVGVECRMSDVGSGVMCVVLGVVGDEEHALIQRSKQHKVIIALMEA